MGGQTPYGKSTVIGRGSDPILVPVLPQGHAGPFFEDFAQMALGGESQIGGDFNVGVGGIGQQVFGQVYFFPEDEFGDGDPFVVFEYF